MYNEELFKDIRPRRKRRFSRWQIATMGFVITAIVLFSIPYRSIETTSLPVVDEMQILSATEVGNDVEIFVSFRKMRSCDFRGVEWYLGDRDRRFKLLSITFKEDRGQPIRSRAVGEQRTGPWLIEGVNKHELYQHTFANARHHCHPLWETTTHFFR